MTALRPLTASYAAPLATLRHLFNCAMAVRERLGKYKLQSLPGAKSLIVPEDIIEELDRRVQAQLQKIRSVDGDVRGAGRGGGT